MYGVCFQPVGHLVATASFDFTAKLWDPRSAEDIQTLRGHQEDVIGVDIDDSGTLLATGSDDKTCRVWDLRMGLPLTVLKEHSGEVKRVAFSPFGKLLATTSGDTTVRLYNTSSFDCLHVLRCEYAAFWNPVSPVLFVHCPRIISKCVYFAVCNASCPSALKLNKAASAALSGIYLLVPDLM